MMRIAVTMLALITAMGCSSGPPPGEATAGQRELQDASRTRSSTASLEAGRESSPTIRIRAGEVRVAHSAFGSARLRGTHLQGLDDHNRHVEYSWARDGQYRVEVSGRYRHRVSGAALGGQGRGRLVSRITYDELPEDFQF